MECCDDADGDGEVLFLDDLTPPQPASVVVVVMVMVVVLDPAREADDADLDGDIDGSDDDDDDESPVAVRMRGSTTIIMEGLPWMCSIVAKSSSSWSCSWSTFFSKAVVVVLLWSLSLFSFLFLVSVLSWTERLNVDEKGPFLSS